MENEHLESKEEKVQINKSKMQFYSSPEEQELARLKEAINRTDTEKFYFLMTLMKMNNSMKKATITYE
jgi:hypothetical protein